MLANSGERGPPWGTPLAVFSSRPFTTTPARRYLPIRDNTRLSWTFLLTHCMSRSWLTVSKNLARSMSTAIRYPSRRYSRSCRTASCAERPGLKPKLDSENSGSKIGVSIWAMDCWTSRSRTMGIPSGRTPPACFGISTSYLGSDLGKVLIYKKNIANMTPIFGLEPPFWP